jgi:hypothetical protein
MSCVHLCVTFDCHCQLVCPLLEAQVQPQEVAHHGSVQAAGVNALSAVGDQMGRYQAQEARGRDLALEEAREAQGTPVAQVHGYGSVPIGCQIRNKYEK